MVNKFGENISKKSCHACANNMHVYGMPNNVFNCLAVQLPTDKVENISSLQSEN